MRKVLMLTLVAVAAAMAPVLADAVCPMQGGCDTQNAACGRTFTPGVAVSGARNCGGCCGGAPAPTAEAPKPAAAPQRTWRMVPTKGGFRAEATTPAPANR